MDSMRLIIGVSKRSKETWVFVRWLEHRMRRVCPVRVRFLVQENVGVREMSCMRRVGPVRVRFLVQENVGVREMSCACAWSGGVGHVHVFGRVGSGPVV